MKFYIKQKVFTFKDKFKITDESQNVLYEIKGKLLSIRNKLDLYDKDGNVLYKSRKKLFRLMPKYIIYDLEGKEVARVVRKFSIRPNFNLTIFGKEQVLDGSLFAHSFSILDNGEMIASISKKIISWGDTYEIEVYEDENVELYLFVVIIMDQVVHERKRKSFTNF